MKVGEANWICSGIAANRLMRYDIRHISIPFRFQYGHSLKSHKGLQAVICMIADERGNIGCGEAVPRDYVTGETCHSILQNIESMARQTELAAETNGQPADILSFVSERMDGAQRWHLQHNTSFPSCIMSALDLARCDLFAKQQDLQMAGYLSNGLTSNAPLVSKPYCASIGFSKGLKGRLKLNALLFLYKRMGFKQFKLKVGTDSDEERIRFVRSKLGSAVKIFADANAAWTPEFAVRKIESLAKYKVWAIEEPLMFKEAARNQFGQVDRLAVLDSNHFETYAWLRERSPLPLIADESLICHQSLTRILDFKAFDILNIRLSKCGGPLLSLGMVQRASDAELQYSVAAMVGESPILATAGAHFACGASELTGQHPKYVQGYSHGLLHKVRFARGEPKLKGAAVSIGKAPGLGLQINEKKLDSITVQRCQFQR